MFERSVEIRNELGLHARPAQLLVQTADQFRSEIFLSKDGVEINGKSIMGVMMLAAAQGSILVIRAEGSDEREAVVDLVALVESKFGED
ncbi:MAG: HPr family phosphocarrier protein [Candidatus Latescibacteria bacterium]|nr:HPr family phosphocarrier protein [Candidatus Latescibacterota bacterium]MCK5327664.1 HPr family phosphocarrier protein [Candidatus Latescibacterota bacterium]MCK5382030.1 HPr family phosphocarrier protein [Candidatus Latescibacterota bacterium]MCK5527410.1 HPr family phosphocarrier protein [Candidatus Latescibacterota bacterium]MCK5734055.1 HPr family phosphocarrier protein [Candidatus Latescibacterota bacterium]